MDKLKQTVSRFGAQLLAGLRTRWWYLLIVSAVVALDQVSKQIAVKYIVRGTETSFIGEIITWRYHQNTGSAYGMLADNRWVFMTVSVIGILLFFLYLYGKRTRNLTLDLGLAFVIGGGIGNMIDRVVLEYVVDFIGVNIFDWKLTNFTCNVADIFVCVGGAMVVIAALVQIIIEERNKKTSPDMPEDPIPAVEAPEASSEQDASSSEDTTV